jgi:hypothetical protein
MTPVFVKLSPAYGAVFSPEQGSGLDGCGPFSSGSACGREERHLWCCVPRSLRGGEELLASECLELLS